MLANPNGWRACKLKEYKVTVLYAADADSLYMLCVQTAFELMQTAEFKRREIQAFERITNQLMRECKACILGLIEAKDIYVDIPEFLRHPNFKLDEWSSGQTCWICQVGMKPYSVPAFTWAGEKRAALDIPELLSYDLIGAEESCNMYNELLERGSSWKGVSNG